MQAERAPGNRVCRNADDKVLACEDAAAVTMLLGEIRYERSRSGWTRFEEEPCPPEGGPAEKKGPFRIAIQPGDRKAGSSIAKRVGLCPEFTTAMIAAVIPQIERSDRIFEVKPRGESSGSVTSVGIEFESTVVAPNHRIIKTLDCDCSAEIASCTYYRQDKVFGSSPWYSFTLGKGVSVEVAVEIKRLFDARAIDAPRDELQRDWALEEGIDGIRRCGDRYYLDWSARNTGGTRVVRFDGSAENPRLRSAEPAEWFCAYPDEEPPE